MSTIGTFVVQQKKEWGEILTGFETKNKYVVSDKSGEQLYYAAEEPGSVIARLFLKALRPFSIAVLSDNQEVVMRVKRPFRFFFHCAEIYDSKGQLIGTIQKRFTLLRRKYSVLSKSGKELCELFGPLLHPWTFKIICEGQEYGKITKKWSGLMKEGFTDADNFAAVFPDKCHLKMKALFLGAVFLIDFVHFENSRR